jgi:hypothetical protein
MVPAPAANETRCPARLAAPGPTTGSVECADDGAAVAVRSMKVCCGRSAQAWVGVSP